METDEIKCDECGKVRTNEPDYTPIQAIMGNPLGWYSGKDGELCPPHIAYLMNMANRTSRYVGWKDES